MQASGTTAPDLPPVPSRHEYLVRDHEYVRHGTLSLLGRHRSSDRLSPRQRRGKTSFARVRRLAEALRRLSSGDFQRWVAAAGQKCAQSLHSLYPVGKKEERANQNERSLDF